jgi:hypothetical protein
MPGVINQGALNPSSLVAPGVYVQVLPPPTFIQGVPTNAFASVGSASWGPVNVPLLSGSPQQSASYWGSIVGTAAAGQISASTNIYDLVTEHFCAFQQSSGAASLKAWGVRVVDGNNYSQGGTPGAGGASANTTGAYASLAVGDASAVLGATLYGHYLGSAGNGITMSIAVGAKGTGYFTVTISPPGGMGLAAEVYPNIAGTAGTSGTTLSTFWTNFVSAITNGINGVRGSSQLVVAIVNPSLASVKPAAPAILAGVALSGGVDGNSNTAGLLVNIVGSGATNPQTGLFALRGLNPPVAVFTLAGVGETAGDLTSYTATVQTFADSEGAVWVVGFVPGETTAAAIAAVNADDYEVTFVYPRAYFNDNVNGPRFHSMAPFYAGLIATLPAWVSPLNQQLKGIIGTERDTQLFPTTGAGTAPFIAPFSGAEIGQLQAGRISVVAKPAPGGNYVGLNTGVNSSSNPASAPVEYSTMTNFLSKSFASSLGKYVGANQGTRPDDRVRQAVRKDFNTFLQGLANNNAINAFSVTCDLTNNTPTGIAAHQLNANVLVNYLSSVWYFLVSFTGGTTVNVTVSTTQS